MRPGAATPAEHGVEPSAPPPGREGPEHGAHGKGDDHGSAREEQRPHEPGGQDLSDRRRVVRDRHAEVALEHVDHVGDVLLPPRSVVQAVGLAELGHRLRIELALQPREHQGRWVARHEPGDQEVQRQGDPRRYRVEAEPPEREPQGAHRVEPAICRSRTRRRVITSSGSGSWLGDRRA